MFKLNSMCTRMQIHNLIGGEIQSYLPHVDGKVVCGCFDTSANPKAPNEILVGAGPNVEKYANVFAEQAEAIPIFMKQASNQWEYIGDYRAVKYSKEPKEVSAKAKAAGREDKVVGVLYLESSS
jgi:hypothetical protein